MIEIKEIRATWATLVVYLIVAIALLIILSGIMTKLADWRIVQRDLAIQALQQKIALGQQIIAQINLPEPTAKALTEAGWRVRELQQTKPPTE